MAQLKSTFVDGSIFSAGSTTDIDTLNGITNRINTHTHEGTNTAFVPITSITGYLMSSGSGSTTATTATDLTLHAFDASDFTANDACLVEVIVTDNSGGAGPVTWKIKIDTSGTDITESTGVGISQNESHYMRYIISQSAKTNDNSLIFPLHRVSASASSMEIGDTNVANWITTAWTLKLNGNAATSGTVYYQWFVWKYRV